MMEMLVSSLDDVVMLLEFPQGSDFSDGAEGHSFVGGSADANLFQRHPITAVDQVTPFEHFAIRPMTCFEKKLIG